MRFCVEHKTNIAEVKVEIIKHHTEGRKLLEANLFFIGTAERKINKKIMACLGQSYPQT